MSTSRRPRPAVWRPRPRDLSRKRQRTDPLAIRLDLASAFLCISLWMVCAKRPIASAYAGDPDPRPHSDSALTCKNAINTLCVNKRVICPHATP